ncbi:MAG: LysM peptidoglycan-binding domain-containing protein [Anaerolineales bacterium]|jgi:LysM repeat protein
MANRNKSVILFSLLALVAITISACTQPYSSVPLETPAADATSLFVSPFPTSDNPMAMVEELSTGTALAETAVALTAGTPLATAIGTEITPDVNATVTPTLEGGATPTATPTLGNVTPSATQPAPTVITNRPGSYTLQKGEFPYCIARRFNLDPAELLSLNSLASGDIYYPNLTLTIPQSGKPFPGTRALRSHPDTYTVTDASQTVYGVACVYGDVDPAAIVQANSGLSLASVLTVGQKINIP